jgi:hypothetical protein
MRITFLYTTSLECPCGLGRGWPLVKELARRGHAVTVLALPPDYGALRKRLAERGHQAYLDQFDLADNGARLVSHLREVVS